MSRTGKFAWISIPNVGSLNFCAHCSDSFNRLAKNNCSLFSFLQGDQRWEVGWQISFFIAGAVWTMNGKIISGEDNSFFVKSTKSRAWDAKVFCENLDEDVQEEWPSGVYTRLELRRNWAPRGSDGNPIINRLSRCFDSDFSVLRPQPTEEVKIV